ncbi:MAG: HlyD family efflux transporter periplasmic adaptor subunit [Oscillospiraceae bacterium]|jgi:putative membrane fusion protein
MNTRGGLMTRIVMLILLCGIFAYLAYYGFSALRDPLSTAAAVQYTVENTVSMTGFVIRDETPLYSEAEYLDLLASEGEKIASGGAVARSFSSEEALSRQARIDELELSLKQLKSIMSEDKDPAAAAKLDTGIIGSIFEINRAVEAGDTSEADYLALTLRSLVLSRAEVFSGSGDIEALRSELEAELNSLLSQSSGQGSDIYCRQSGIFSSQTDGYETILSSDVLDSLSCKKLDAYAEMAPQTESGVFGKCITGIRWYFAAAVSAQEAGYFTEGTTVTLRFLGGYTENIDMRVDKVAKPEDDGRCLIILSTTRALSQTTALRRQTAEVIRDSYTGIRIPKAALRVSDEGKTGVYILAGPQARFREVTVVSELDDYLIVSEDKSNAGSLRVGDSVITKAKDLYDGKVLAEE